jgi:hypothetical protein
MKFACQGWFIALLFPVLATLPTLSQAADNLSDSQIAVRLTRERTNYRPGDDIRLRVEIWNKSSHDLFISKEINFSSITGLELAVSKGEQTYVPEVASISDSFGSKRTNYLPLSAELSGYWIALPPGHFYGGEIVLSPLEFPVLRNPGRYRIQGKYSSQGFLANNVNNSLLHYAEELKKMPYASWVGEVQTNSVSIDVNSHRRANITRR